LGVNKIEFRQSNSTMTSVSCHDRVLQALRELGDDYVRYDPWLPDPKLAVAELEPPATSHLNAEETTLPGLGVAAVTLP